MAGRRDDRQKKGGILVEKDRETVQNLQKKIMEDLDFGEELSDEQLKELISKYLLEKDKILSEKNFELKFSIEKEIGKTKKIYYFFTATKTAL